ncbi:MAG: winged helix DNA-binding domain-containing protein [Desulfobacterales bacterium]|nr:winged helix DNA-binding domain-containing protein [Desulfobacterales bacterium]
MKITKIQASHFILAHQKLWPPRNLQGKEDILDYIRQVGCIQFDPLDKVGYNPNLVLQSRIEDFRSEYLYELLYSDRSLLDGWDKNMAIYPVEDWPYFSRYREASYRRYGDKSMSINEILPEVREALEQRGPLSSIDLKFDTKVNWSWAPTRVARAALESMYFWGELIIHHKVGTRKVYDFAKKHLPPELLSMSDPNFTMEQFYEWNVKRRIGAIGLLWGRASDAWLGISWMKSKERNEAISRLVDNGELLLIEIEGIKYPCYIRKEEEELLHQIIEGIIVEPQASFIAPLDNFIWDRKLIKEIFGFEYTWEVYKPVLERKYGYYVLPVLYGDKFVARFEPNFIKKTGKLEIINWWWEPDTVITEEMKQALVRSFQQFLSYLGASQIQLNSETTKKLEWLLNIID